MFVHVDRAVDRPGEPALVRLGAVEGDKKFQGGLPLSTDPLDNLIRDKNRKGSRLPSTATTKDTN